MAKEKIQSAGDSAAPVSLIDHIEVDVEALLGDATMTVAQLNVLVEGDVVRLDRQINEPVAIRVNGRVIGRGEIVTVNDCFAVRVTRMGE
ncbi:MAG: FliM/FliN family flagellar motor switch protein [Sphingorhabdus sp.]|uniref:FliM/FliN family flagellar motor switch protein n=1 Tax=Sphingorhabdus sp. TaxID=1902408 RepID=UPI003C9345F3